MTRMTTTPTTLTDAQREPLTNAENDDVWHAACDALRIIDQQAARIVELEAALQTIKRAYGAATYTHGGDLRGLDEAAIDRALEVLA